MLLAYAMMLVRGRIAAVAMRGIRKSCMALEGLLVLERWIDDADKVG